MTRPAIVIGLGGTGQWILTFLKKDLLEIGDGEIPAGVKLLCFDTTSSTTAETGKDSKGKDQQDVRAGAVHLTHGTEFIPIGGQVGPLASEITNGKHTHMHWFPAKTLLAKLPPGAFNTSEGSGQIRHMGRISIFKDLSSLNESKILSHIRSAIQELQRLVNQDHQLEIMIVGSFAGGTGAGMLVDIPVLIRAQAERLVARNYVIRGFFVLPKAFSAGGIGENRDMYARSFAAWRELDRFMIVSERFGVRQINYHETNADLRLRLDRRAYDVSYLVDPSRPRNPLDSIKPEQGLYPAVAQCLSAILDDKAGKEYTEFVTTNLAGKLAQLPRRPYHSSIGSYTLKVPAYYAKEKFSHQLALDILKEFIAPEINSKGRVTHLSELHNREVVEGQVGTRAVIAFLNASAFNVAGVEIPNTKLPQLIAEIMAKEGVRSDELITMWARNPLRQLSSLTDIGQDDAGKAIVRNIQDELNLPIWKEVAPSRVFGDTPRDALTRMKNKIPAVRNEHYGMDTAGGQRLRGKYGKALEDAKAAQVVRFHKLIQAWTLHALNGESTDPLIARGGKLGYVRSFYDGLVETSSYFISYLNKVRLKRNEELLVSKRTKQAVEQAWKQYEQDAGKGCIFTFWDNNVHPDAHRAQRNYLQAEQMDIDTRKGDILLDVLAEVAKEIQSIAEKIRDEFDRWITVLATGNQAVLLNGLFHEAKESLDNVNVNNEIDKRLERVSKLIGEHEYESKEDYIRQALQQLKWHVEPNSDRLSITCGIENPSENPDKPPQYKAFARDSEKPDQYNLRLLLQLAEVPYLTLHKDRPLALEIQKTYETGQKLALAVNEMGEPFIMPSSSHVGPEVMSCMIRVNSNRDNNTTAYFQEFIDVLRARNPQLRSNLNLVDSEDIHKLTVVRSDDLIPSTDFAMWATCRDAYIAQVTDPHRGIPASELHIFPAEINACYYEAEMPGLLEKDFRTLHPEVVALLEDRDRFEMFFLAYALGFIYVDDKNAWLYKLPTMEIPINLTLAKVGLSGDQEEDFFQVIHNFALDGRDQTPGLGQTRWIDWKKLLSAIIDKEKELGKTKLVNLYKKEIDTKNTKGFIQKILSDVERLRSKYEDEALRKRIGQEQEDLADLAKTVYKMRIKKFEA